MASVLPLISRDKRIVGEAIVDDVDYDRCHMYTWRLKVSGSGQRYANRVEDGTNIYLHEFIFGQPDVGLGIDHINRDGLDNRRLNLRPASRGQQQQNRRVHRNSRSGVRGVYWDAAQRDWRASVKSGGKRIYSARFPTLALAAAAVREARSRLLTHATD